MHTTPQTPWSAAPGQPAPVHIPSAVYQPTGYGQPQPQVVVVQQPAAPEPRGLQASPATLAALTVGGGLLAVALLLTVAVVAVAVAAGAVSLTIAWLVLKSLAGGRR